MFCAVKTTDSVTIDTEIGISCSDVDDAMADARRNLNWEKQWECSIDPETAKKIRDDRKPEIEESCSMCGKFCAVRSMNKALNGEHIDIL